MICGSFSPDKIVGVRGDTEYKELFLGVFFKLLEFFEQVYDCSLSFCDLEFIERIFFGEHFYWTVSYRREGTGWIFHIVGIPSMRSRHVDLIC